MSTRRRVLIAEDGPVSARVLAFHLEKAGYEAVIAADGQQAIAQAARGGFDAVITDLWMPHVGGLEVIRHIRARVRPVPVILVVTALTSDRVREEALGSGADGFLGKPIVPREVLSHLASCLLRRHQRSPVVASFPARTRTSRAPFAGVAIATSTGGPPALRALLPSLPARPDAAFFVVQHGPAWMLESFAERLDDECTLEVRLGSAGTPVEPGHLYVAPGGSHLVVDPDTLRLALSNGPPESYVRPAADPLMRSLAEAFGPSAIAVILTGLGRDGASGAGHIAAAGGAVIVQNPASATAPSMPSAAIAMDLGSTVVPLDDVAGAITQAVERLGYTPAAPTRTRRAKRPPSPGAERSAQRASSGAAGAAR